MKNIYYYAAIISLSIFNIISFPTNSMSAEIACPPLLKMVSSNPRTLSDGVSTERPVIITWDKETLETLSDGLRDLKPALESVNISGGRYGMGTLLTTEWGIGGTASWMGNVEIIVPEATLEPGTQYRVWTYLYITIRNGAPMSCVRLGGEVVFKTAGIAPDDGSPVRNIDLSKIYHGDEYGHGDASGTVKELNQALNLVTLDDIKMGKISVVVYMGIPIFKDGQIIPFDKIKVGDRVTIRFTGGRAVTLEVNK
ncbi:MAG: hypothetical protein IT392_08305 [Nitrospirae bacterium]|nr:hypothetical protein [Nitrospirota bacterium]